MAVVTFAPPAIADSHSPSDQTLPFLTMLFGRVRADYLFVIYALPWKKAYFFQATTEGIEQASSKVEELDHDGQNVFAGMYLLRERPKKQGGRGEISDVRGICAPWIDIDIKPKDRYPGEFPEALKIVDAMPLKPSAINNSGHGLHGYWPLEEPLYIDSDADRTCVLDFMSRWKATCQGAASSVGYTVDSVFDLARVMRIPGSRNLKDSEPIWCEIIEQADPLRRYSVKEIEAILTDVSEQRARPQVVLSTVANVELHEITELPEKIRLALEGDPTFRSTWSRDRLDFADQSDSAYCYSIAQYLVKLGLSDEEIAEILFTWRDANEAKTKPPSWYVKEAEKARKVVEERTRGDSVAMVTWEDPTAEQDAQREADTVRESAPLAWLQRQAVFKRVPIIGARKLGRRDGQFELLLEGGRTIPLGTATDLLNPQRAQAAIADAVGVAIPNLRREGWRLVADAILALAGPGEDLGTDPLSEMRGWLQAYIDQYDRHRRGTSVVDMSDASQLASAIFRMGYLGETNAVFWTTDGRLVVHPDKLVIWLTAINRRIRTTPSEVRLRLRRLDFEQRQLSARWTREALYEATSEYSVKNGPESGVAKRRAWVSPPNFDPAA